LQLLRVEESIAMPCTHRTWHFSAYLSSP